MAKTIKKEIKKDTSRIATSKEVIFYPNGIRHNFRDEASPADAKSISGLTKKLQLLDMLYNQLMNMIPNPDPNIRNDGLKSYDKTMNDPVVTGCINSVIEGVNAMEWEVMPNEASEDEISTAYDIINDLFDTEFREQTLSANWYGNSYIELLWEQESLWLPVSSMEQSRANFFYIKNQDGEYETRMLTNNSNLTGETVPKFKLLVPTYRANAFNPYGRGLLMNLYKSAFIKDNAWNFWSIFVEDHGTPKVEAEISKDLREFMVNKLGIQYADQSEFILTNLETLRQNGFFVHFEGITVKPLNSGSSDNGVSHKDLMDFCDKQISILILGHNGASQATPGKLGSDVMALTALQSRITSYANFIAKQINTILDWVHEINFGQGNAPRIRFFHKDDVTLLKTKAETYKILYDMGVTPNEDCISEEFNLSKDHFTLREMNIIAPQPPTDNNPPAASTTPILNTIDFIDTTKPEDILQEIQNSYPDIPERERNNILTQIKLIARNIKRKLGG